MTAQSKTPIRLRIEPAPNGFVIWSEALDWRLREGNLPEVFAVACTSAHVAEIVQSWAIEHEIARPVEKV